MKLILQIIGLILFLGPMLIILGALAITSFFAYGWFNPFNIMVGLIGSMTLGFWIISKAE